MFPLPCSVDLLPLLLNKVLLHGIVIVMICNQAGKLPLLNQHRPSALILSVRIRHLRSCLVLSTASFRSLSALHVLPTHLAVIQILIVSGLISCMIDADYPVADRCATKIVDCEVCAPLILVLEPTEAATLSRLLVPCELKENWLTKLAENGDNVAFRKLVGQSTKVDKGCIAVVDVPGSFRFAATEVALVYTGWGCKG
jgi:hypothetical protein